MKAMDRMQKALDRLAERLSDPDFWKTVGILAALLLVGVSFFWVAVGFDALARGASLGVRCRAQDNTQALAMFVSPFVIGLSCVAAAGEFFTQHEERRRYKRPLRWGRILLKMGLALGFLALFGSLMILWC